MGACIGKQQRVASRDKDAAPESLQRHPALGTVEAVYLRKAYDAENILQRNSTYENRRFSDTKEAYSANGTLSYRGSTTDLGNRGFLQGRSQPSPSTTKENVFVFSSGHPNSTPTTPVGRHSTHSDTAGETLSHSPRSVPGASFEVSAGIGVAPPISVPLPKATRVMKIKKNARTLPGYEP